MPINLKGEKRFDTRGLPEGYDPHKLYEYRYDTLVKDSTALESFLHKYIPYSLIKSFAIAIDPLWQFKVAPGVITKVTRTRSKATLSVLDRKMNTRTRTSDSWDQLPNYKGVSACWTPYVIHQPGFTTNTTQSNAQGPLFSRSRDTTKRTRLIGSDQGELEMFKCTLINSPPRTATTGETFARTYSVNVPGPGCAAIGGLAQNFGFHSYIIDRETSSRGAVFPVGSYNALRDSEINFANALMQKHAISLLKEWSPFRRDYTLFRNVVELRDIPRSVLQLQNTLRDLKSLFVSLGSKPELRRSVFDLKRTSKNIPKEYLSYHFGWKQTWKDVTDLLGTPEKMAKKISFLIRRSGQPTTFRVKRNFSFAEKDVPGFDYGPTFAFIDMSPTWPSRQERECEVRLVVNANFDFPPLNEPSFRYKNYFDRLGIIPRPTDMYNLVPWTWLVDWFTGLGNYVELIDTINRDPSLINWGMITCHTSGKIITEFQSKSRRVDKYNLDNIAYPDTEVIMDNRHTSILEYECQTRKDVSTILDVKLTSTPSSLTAYQKSILGALLAQRFPGKH